MNVTQNLPQTVRVYGPYNSVLDMDINGKVIYSNLLPAASYYAALYRKAEREVAKLKAKAVK